MRRTIIHAVDLGYTHQELLAIFTLAVKEDVNKGGRYDARSNAINIWSHPWTPKALRQESTVMGTFHCAWERKHRIYQVETDLGFSFTDLMCELALLERKALSGLRHGIPPASVSSLATPEPFQP